MYDDRPMSYRETALWMVFCTAGLTLVHWLDARPGNDGFWHYLEAVGIAMIATIWVSILKPPLRWWIAFALGAEILIPRLHTLMAKLELGKMQRLPEPLDMPDPFVWAWALSGLVAGYLYARNRGWRLSINCLDFPAALHCLIWGPVIGPALLLGCLKKPPPSFEEQWWRQRPALQALWALLLRYRAIYGEQRACELLAHYQAIYGDDNYPAIYQAIQEEQRGESVKEVLTTHRLTAHRVGSN